MTNGEQNQSWISMSEASASTPYSAEYLSLLARKGKLTSKKVGGVWYTTRAILEEYMRAQMVRAHILKGTGMTNELMTNAQSSPNDQMSKGDASDPSLSIKHSSLSIFPVPAPAPMDYDPSSLKQLRSMHADIRAYMQKNGLPLPAEFAPHKPAVLAADKPDLSNLPYYLPQVPQKDAIKETIQKVHETRTSEVEKALERVLTKHRSAPGQTLAGRAASLPRHAWKHVSGSRVLLLACLVGAVLLTISPVPFVFSAFENAAGAVKHVFTDADTVLGARPGTHKNEILLLDNQGNIAIGGHIDGSQLTSSAADGTAPIVVDSKTLVNNLNAQYLGGASSTDFTLAFVTANGAVTTEDVTLGGSVEVGQTLAVKGAEKLLGELSVGGSLKAFGPAEFADALSVAGPATFKDLVAIEDNLSVQKNISVRGSLEAGSAVMGASGSFGSLGVSGDLSASGNIALGSSNHDTTLAGKSVTLDKDGDLTLAGTASSSALSATDATIGNATTTNFFTSSLTAAFEKITSLAADSISVSALSATSSVVDNATTTNATTTNAFISSLVAGNSTSTTLYSDTGTFNDLFVNNYEQNNGTFQIRSSVSTGDIFSVLDTAVTDGTLIHQSLTANAGNGQTSKGQIIDLADNTTAGGGYSALTINVTGSGTGSGSKTLLDLNPGTNKEIVFDATGALHPTTDVSQNSASIGTPSFYFKTGYFDSVIANNIAGTVTSGDTASHTWTLGSTETGDANEALVFQRNSGSGNATLSWNASSGTLNDQRFLSVNYPFNATYTITDSSIATSSSLYSGLLTNNTTSGTQKLLSLTNTGTGTTENGIYIDNTGTAQTGLEIHGAWTTGIKTNNNSINAGTGSLSAGSTTISSLTNSGSTVYGTLAIADHPTGGAIGAAAATVDVSTSFNIAQTTAGQTLTIPSPTSATAGRVAIITNTGSAAFTLLGAALNAGSTAQIVWNGSAWVGSVPSAWGLSGNSGTNPATNFLGTTDAQPLVIKTNNSEAMRVLSGGNVGIGTTNPLATLDVNGSIRNSTASQSVSTNHVDVISPSTNADLFASITSGSVAIANSRLNIQGTTGNVGIGTTNPGVKLNIVGSNNMFKLENTDGTTASQYAQMELKAGTADNYIWTNNQNSAGFYGGSNALNIYGGSGSPIAFFTNAIGTPRMVIDTSGSVGIGITNPGTTLDVQAASPIIREVATTGTNHAYFASENSGGDNLFGQESSTGGTIFSGSSAYAAVFGTDAARSVQFATNNAVRETIDSSGNVGIGLTNPSYKLDVSGTINLTGVLYGNGKEAIRTDDTYLRLNNASAFSNGVYTPGNFRSDGTVYVGGTSYYINAGTSNLNGLNVGSNITTSGALIRNAAGVGYLSGNYPSSETGGTSGAIYSIGGGYTPGTTSLGNMYGIGYSVNNNGTSGFAISGAPADWGLYVAAGGTAHAFIQGSTGILYSDSGGGVAIRGGANAIMNNNQFYCDSSSACHFNYSGSGVTNIGNAAGIFFNGSVTQGASQYIYPGFQSGQGSGTNGSYYIAGSTSYGLYSNTGLDAAGGLYDAGNRVCSATIGTCPVSISGNAATLTGFTVQTTRYNQDANSLLTSGIYNAEATPANWVGSYSHMIVAMSNDTGLQIAGGYTDDNLYFRGWYSSGAGFTPWRTILHNGNFNSYAPTLTGGGASGTWGISISGNASTATLASTVTINTDRVDGTYYQAMWTTSGGTSLYSTNNVTIRSSAYGGIAFNGSAWTLEGNPTYGLYSNTGFDAQGGLYDVGSRVCSGQSCNIGSQTMTVGAINASGLVYSSVGIQLPNRTGSGDTCSSGLVGKLVFSTVNAGHGNPILCSNDNGTIEWQFVQTGFGGGVTPDLAEYVPVQDESIEGGEILSTSDVPNPTGTKPYDTFYAERATSGNAVKMLGIVSTNPGQILNTPRVQSANLDDLTKGPNLTGLKPLALAGRVPVKVTTENGEVKAGDYVTVSDTTPGEGMKAVDAGEVVGQALDDYDPSTGEVLVLVGKVFWPGQLSLQDINNRLSNVETALADATSTIAQLQSFASTTSSRLDAIEALLGGSGSTTAALTLDATTTQSITGSVLAYLGASVQSGLTHFGSLVVDALTIGSKEHPTGITLYDTITGEPYCLTVTNGVSASTAGECGSTSGQMSNDVMTNAQSSSNDPMTNNQTGTSTDATSTDATASSTPSTDTTASSTPAVTTDSGTASTTDTSSTPSMDTTSSTVTDTSATDSSTPTLPDGTPTSPEATTGQSAGQSATTTTP